MEAPYRSVGLTRSHGLATCGFVLLALATAPAAWADVVTDMTAPKLFWVVLGGCAYSPEVSQQLYDTPDAAGAAYFGCIAESNAHNSNVRIDTVSNFRPSSSHYSLLNNQPSAYAVDETTEYIGHPDETTVQNDIPVVLSHAVCPVGWSYSVGLPQNNSVTGYCYYSHQERQSQSCGWGNPIFPDAGLKLQRELDYESPDGLLKFERTYRNAGGGFMSTATHVGLFDYSTPLNKVYSACLSRPYVAPFNNSTYSGSYCFPIMSTGATQALLWDERGLRRDLPETNGVPRPTPDLHMTVTKTQDAQGALQWLVRTEDNKLEIYDANGSLVSRTWPDGKGVSFGYSNTSTPASVAPYAGLLIAETDTFGRLLQFSYDSAGRLAQMLDPNGRPYRYSYDASSWDCLTSQCDRLIAVTYPDQFIRQYVWNEPSLTSATDEPYSLTGISEQWPASDSTDARTSRFASFGYDSKGAAISTEHANGVNRFAVVSNNGSSVSITDPLGSQYVESYQSYFGATYPTGVSQPGGAGCSASNSRSVYDANTANLTLRDDFDGHRACYAYDASRNLETTRVEGLSYPAVCQTYTASGSILPVGSRKTSTQWHPDWRLVVKVAEPGAITTNIYNGQPDPFNANAVANCAPSTALLPDGKPIAVLCKVVVQATTDVDGSKGFSATLDTTVPNRVWSNTYNQYGQVLTAKGPRTDVDDTTTYAYYSDTTSTHTVGDLQTVTDALGHTTTYTQYDPSGNVLEKVDANNVVTDYSYDARQRLKTVKVGGQTTNYAYWPNGLLKQVTLPDQSYVAYTYDDAHRLTDVSDSAANGVHYVLDSAGNHTFEQYKDPNGVLKSELAHIYDALGRVQQTAGRE